MKQVSEFTSTVYLKIVFTDVFLFDIHAKTGGPDSIKLFSKLADVTTRSNIGLFPFGFFHRFKMAAVV